MNISRSFASSLLVLVLVLGASGCQGAGSDSDAGETGGEQPELGDTPLPSCEAAMFSYEQFVAEVALPEPDIDYLIELYRGDPPDLSGESPTPGGTALQRWVREVGARLGRVEAGVLVDDAAIEAALDLAAAETGEARRLALTDAVAVLRAIALFDVRGRLAGVADSLPDPARDPSLLHAEWDSAWCVWTGVIGPIADAVDAETSERWTEMITDAFASGYAGIIGPEEAWAPDDFAVKPGKQIVEKGSFGVTARRLVALAEQARAEADSVRAREALGLFGLLEDRVRGRNTPAIELIETMLGGAVQDIDPALIETELAIAFIKRARKYCDEAVLAEALGTSEGAKGVEEGVIYTRIVLPVLIELLADQGFDDEQYMLEWSKYRDAVLADDSEAAVAASAELVMWNCAGQAALGIAACTDSLDE
jgi:hypothetical protein